MQTETSGAAGGSASIAALGDNSLKISRRFDAPRQRVFHAFTDHDLVKQWLWARESPLVVCKFELRAGGTLRYVWQLPDGSKMGLSGTYREIVAPDRIVHTELFDEDWTDGDTLVTTTFDEVGGRTIVRMRIDYSTSEARDRAMTIDMTGGMEESFRKLDALLRDEGQQ